MDEPTETEAIPLGPGQQVLVPHTLPQLLAALKGANGSGARIVAGNTGAGVYKNWPLEATLVSINKGVCLFEGYDLGPVGDIIWGSRGSMGTACLGMCTHCGLHAAPSCLTSASAAHAPMQVAELQVLEVQAGTLVVGAAVTISALIGKMEALAGDAAGGAAGVWREMAAHLRRWVGARMVIVCWVVRACREHIQSAWKQESSCLGSGVGLLPTCAGGWAHRW